MKERTLENVKPGGGFSDIQNNLEAGSPFWERFKKAIDSLIWRVFSPWKTWWGRKSESQIYPGIFNIKQWKKKQFY